MFFLSYQSLYGLSFLNADTLIHTQYLWCSLFWPLEGISVEKKKKEYLYFVTYKWFSLVVVLKQQEM